MTNTARLDLERAFAARRPAFALWTEVGVRWLDHRPGLTVLELDLGARHHNPVGVVHGGVLMGLVDTCMGFAATSVLEGAGETTATISLAFTFVRAVREGTVRAEGRVLRKGRNVLHLEGTLWTPEGEVAARAVGAWAVIPPRSA